jgi:hypothetical protein
MSPGRLSVNQILSTSTRTALFQLDPSREITHHTHKTSFKTLFFRSLARFCSFRMTTDFMSIYEHRTKFHLLRVADNMDLNINMRINENAITKTHLLRKSI